MPGVDGDRSGRGNAEALLRQIEAADRALYQAKEMGRDQVRLAPG